MNVNDITIAYEEDGMLTLKELDKVILTKGAWSTIIFQYQDLEKDGGYGPIKYTIRRYQKKHDEYRLKSKFNISNNEQAQKIVDALSHWLSSDSEMD